MARKIQSTVSTKKAKPVPAQVAFEARSVADLHLVIESAESAAWEVEREVNPHNIFALRYRDLAAVAKELIRLIEERGHTGIPVKEGQ